jgi:(p)ppGpp synthase/HD superfamily hydrolase
MGRKAVLTKVNDKEQTRVKLPSWTSEDPDEIIAAVEKGKERTITTQDCDECKADLEKNNGAVVQVKTF